MDRDEAIAELERRKTSQISKDEAIAEIARRNTSSSQNPKRVGWGEVAKDVGSGLLQAPLLAGKVAYSAIKDFIPATRQLTGYNPETGGYELDRLKHGWGTLAAGAGSGLGGYLNIPGNIIDYAQEREIAPEWLSAWKPPEAVKNFNYRKALGVEDQRPGDDLLYGAGQFAPYIPFGPAAPGVWAVGQNENPVSAMVAPKLGKAAEVTGKLIGKGINRLTPSGWIAKYTKDNLSLKELADNMRAAEGTNTPLGDVLESPRLKKKFENELASSNVDWEVEQTYRKINDQIQQKAENILNEKLGKNAPPGDANLFIKDALVDAYKDHTTVKNNLYNEVTDVALQDGFNLKLPRFNRLIDADVAALTNSPMFLADKSLMNSFNDLISVGGKKPSIKGAKYFANLFDTEAKALVQPDASSRSLRSLYDRAAKALREDVKNEISEKGSSSLQEAFKAAEDYYKDDFVQFLDRDLYKLLNENKDAQSIIHEIIKPGATKDAYTLIEKVQKILPENQKNTLGYNYLRGALNKDFVLEPSKMNSLIKALGKRQFEALFPDASMRQTLLDFSRLRDMNSEAASFLANPKTGQRTQTNMNKIRRFLVEGGLGGAAGAAAFGTLGGLLGIPVSYLAKNATNKYLAKILTDQEFRAKVADKITKEQGKKK
jgi:hypothetical protein